jgi:hypothetical protein
MSRRALILATVAACGTASVPIEAYQARIDDAECGRLIRCGEIGTMAGCQTYRAQNGRFTAPITPSVIAAVAAGLVTYDGEQAAECIDQIAGLSCSLADQAVRLQPTSGICRGVLRADRRLGGSCYLNEECESRQCVPIDSCDVDQCCIGTCIEPANLARIGDECTHVDCAPNAWCSNGVCYPLLPQGAPCGAPLTCDWGLECFGTCKPALEEGDPCDTSVGFPWCGFTLGLFCDPDTMRCIRLHGNEGAPCDPADEHACELGACDPVTHVCHWRARVGEVCGVGFGSCVEGASCVSSEHGESRCVPLIDNGSPCFNRSDLCASGLCGPGAVCIDPPVCF